jgi:mannosyl-3-phosphoglycerate phosphatase
MRTQIVIFTDLDGTLLDSRYSFRKALPAVHSAVEKKVPLVLCSSKTRAEIERLRSKLNNNDPFITENGGGIFIPRGYFESLRRKFLFSGDEDGNYQIIKLGASYEGLRKVMHELRDEGFDVRGFGDMSAREISSLTGLTLADARLAGKRDFDEPFILRGSSRSVGRLRKSILARGLRYTQGEFYHLMGDSDKGKAVTIVSELYVKRYGRIRTIALGDSPNDIEMLQNVDVPVVVRKANGRYHPRVLREVRGIRKADGIGPEGWKRAVQELLVQYG